MASIWQFRGSSGAGGQSFSTEVLNAAEGSPLLARLLANRGITQPDEIQAFLNLENYQPASAWDLPDMQAAVDRILRAIQTQENILIYGDFDVDGITGTSVLYETFKKHLGANVSYYIPDRATEGHGLNSAAVIRLASSRKVKLLITTDTGITNFSEVSLLNGLGVDTIITDHHALPENLPPAIANINAQRLATGHPLKEICGAGVAYKLCELLLEKSLPAEEAAVAAENLLDIVAVGTVVDMVPLVQENRYLVYRGLQVLNRRQRPGFQALLEEAGVKPDSPINSETLGFTIGPRLNALGRLERAEPGVELITTRDPERIRVIAAHLEFLNRRRRELCDQTYLEAESHLQKIGGLNGNRAIILASPEWNPGIIGIVASRLIEKYSVPVFMMVIDADKAEARCSARSIPGFHLHDELLALEHYFLAFGGHAGAGGFALKLERLESFKRDLYTICNQTITDEQMRPLIEVDAKLEWSQVNPHLISLVDRLAPFGMKNPSPKFVLENVTVAAQRYLGEEERHMKLVLSNGKSNQPLEAIIWNFGRKERFDAHSPYSFVVVPGLNNFNNVTKVQLIVEDYMAPQAAQLATQSVEAPAAPPNLTLPRQRGGDFESLKARSSKVRLSDAESSEMPETPETQWVDHRSRESVDVFMGQLMLPLQDQRDVLIYHEGKKPDIPFLDERLLCGRMQVRPADELVFWDVPPSLAEFRRVMDVVQPQVVHLVGGKYQAVPIYPSEQNYLKLIMQLLRRSGEEATLEVSELAAQLATTNAVATQGLILLTRLCLLEVQLVEPGQAQRLLIKQLPQQAATEIELTRLLEYVAFQQALKDVGRFRGWLLKSSLDTIKRTLRMDSSDAAELAATSEPLSHSPALSVTS